MNSHPFFLRPTTLVSTFVFAAGFGLALSLAVPAARAAAVSHAPAVSAVPRVSAVPAAVPHGLAAMPAPARNSFPGGQPGQQAAFLVNQALSIATQVPVARPVAVRTAAALLPRLPVDGGALGRDALTAAWMRLEFSPALTRAARLEASDSFFDSAVTTDPKWAATLAPRIPDAAAQAAAYLRVSLATEPGSWDQGEQYARLAQAAARRETDPMQRANALVFVAYRIVTLGAEDQAGALEEAQIAVHQVGNTHSRDELMATLVGAAAKYDLGTASTMSGEITDPELKKLAEARINIAQISQSTLTTRASERVTAMATAAARYDASARPILLQLPPQPEVLQAIAETLPPIAPNENPGISTTELEHVWVYSQTAPEGAYRDQLQSRAARLMVLHDLWRGRDWGKQLKWKGGRVQVGAFLKQVLAARQSQLSAGALQDVARQNAARAYQETTQLAPAARAEALLLLAGELLG